MRIEFAGRPLWAAVIVLAICSLVALSRVQADPLFLAQTGKSEGSVSLARVAADGRVILVFVAPDGKIVPAHLVNTSGDVAVAESVENSSIIWVQLGEDGTVRPLQVAADGSLIPARASADGRPLLPETVSPRANIFAAQISVTGALLPLVLSVDEGMQSVEVLENGTIVALEAAAPRKAKTLISQIGVDNSGHGSTGLYNVTASVTSTDLWELGHLGTVSATTSATDPQAFKRLYGSYAVPVEGLIAEVPDTLSANVFYYSSHYETQTSAQPAPAKFKQKGFSLSPSYKQNVFFSSPDGRSGNIHSVLYGLTYDKSWSRDFGFQQDDEASIVRFPISLGYNFTHYGSPAGLLSLGIRYVRNLPVGAADDGDDYRKDRQDADPIYDKLAAELTHAMDWQSGWSTTAAVFAQYAREPMISAESIFLGGFTSIRGLEDAKTIGDKGVTSQLELLTPKKEFMTGFSTRLLAFADGGWVKKEKPPAGEPSTESAISLGVGLKLEGPQNTFLNFTAGWLAGGSAVDRYSRDDGRLQVYLSAGLVF